MDQVIGFLQNYGLQTLLTVVVGYLLGSISFSIIFTRLFQKADIRTMGSGNAGFTNVLRSAGKAPSILTFAFDFGKGALAVFLGTLIFGSEAPFMLRQCAAYLAGFACILGHIYPMYFGFKGGKGVLTSSAMVLLIDWRVFLVVIGVFLVVFLISKIISLASISAAISFPIGTFLITYFADYLPAVKQGAADLSLGYVFLTTGLALLLAVLVVVKHHANIGRLIRGEEKKITAKKKD